MLNYIDKQDQSKLYKKDVNIIQKATIVKL